MPDYRPDVLEIGADSIIASAKHPDARARAHTLLEHCERLGDDASRAARKLRLFLGLKNDRGPECVQVPLVGGIEP